MLKCSLDSAIALVMCLFCVQVSKFCVQQNLISKFGERTVVKSIDAAPFWSQPSCSRRVKINQRSVKHEYCENNTVKIALWSIHIVKVTHCQIYQNRSVKHVLRKFNPLSIVILLKMSKNLSAASNIEKATPRKQPNQFSVTRLFDNITPMNLPMLWYPIAMKSIIR